MQNTKKFRNKLSQREGLINKKIAILSGSTIGEIKNYLELSLLLQGIKPTYYIGEYTRYYEEAVFENIELEEFKPDIIYLHTTNKNIMQFPILSDNEEIRNQKLQEEYSRFEQIWHNLNKKYNCVIIQNNFEYLPHRAMGNADIYFSNGNNKFINDLNSKIHEYARNNKNIYINDINYQSAYLGLENWFDMSKWYLYKYAMSPEGMELLSQNIANIIKSIYGKNKKSLVLDLDNTLWGGVIGDDGVDNIRLGDETPEGRAFLDFQKYSKQLKEQGVIINIASKNEYENALLGLKHPSSALKKEDFTSIKANWDNKHDNINTISKETNLLLESFVFLDDNPVERELVKAQLPQVAVPQIMEPEYYVRDLDKLGYFEVTSLSEDDLKRSVFYAQNQKRQIERQQFANYESYLASLRMNSTIEPFREEQIERITQLINKTNQFNLTTKRYTQEEIKSFMERENYITVKADLVDKFGDNGLVSIVIGKVNKENVDKILIDLWIMSCRVFKRNLEYAVFDNLIKECQKRKIKQIEGIYKPTVKNMLVKEFYKELGFRKISSTENEDKWQYIIPDDYKNKNKVIGEK